MSVPSWWFFVSGVFFVLGWFTFIALIVLVLRLTSMVRELQPKVERLADRVESLAEKLESTASSAKGTVENVGAGIRQIVNALGGAIVGSAQKLEKLSTVLVAAMAIVRIYKELSSLKQQQAVDKEGPGEA